MYKKQSGTKSTTNASAFLQRRARHRLIHITNQRGVYFVFAAIMSAHDPRRHQTQSKTAKNGNMLPPSNIACSHCRTPAFCMPTMALIVCFTGRPMVACETQSKNVRNHSYMIPPLCPGNSDIPFRGGVCISMGVRPTFQLFHGENQPNKLNACSCGVYANKDFDHARFAIDGPAKSRRLQLHNRQKQMLAMPSMHRDGCMSPLMLKRLLIKECVETPNNVVVFVGDL